jgi:drug/metabolite transporter (DMT)-like permease
MAAILALSAAVAYGVGDFLGGVAARRVPPTAVVLWSHIVGLGMLVTLAPLVGGEVTPRALAVGAGAGVLGGAGVALFYRGLAVGAMSVVAPVAALLSAAVPVVVGLATGERPSTAALAGIALALGAVVLISREGDHAPAGPLRW